MVNNSFTVIGRLVRDIEVNTINESTKVCNFTLAGDVGFGENRHAVFPNFVAWNRQVDTLEQYVKKGQQIAVEATYDEQHWETEDGEKRTAIRFRVNNIFLTGSKAENERETSDDEAPRNFKSSKETVSVEPDEDMDEMDSVPF